MARTAGDKTNWYWIVNSTTPTTQVYQSSSQTFVANNAAAFLTWLTDGNGTPTMYGSGSPIYALANNGSGKVRCTVPTSGPFQTGQYFNFSGSTGTPLLNGNQQITVVDATHIDVTAITFVASDAKTFMFGASLTTDATTLATELNSYNIGTAAPAASTQTSSANVTVANPIKSYYSFVLTGTAHNVILPPMNAPGALAIGATVTIHNDSAAGFFGLDSEYFGVYATDGTTLINYIMPGETFDFTLLTNATANGTFSFRQVSRPRAGTHVKGLTAGNLSGTSTISISVNFLECLANNSLGETVTFRGGLRTVTVTGAQTGSLINGRDQTALFAAGAAIHIYAVIGPSFSYGLLASTAADPQGYIAPTLPTGFTHWCYLFTVFYPASALPLVTVRGNLVTYTTASSTGVALSGGAAVGGTPTTAVSLTTLVPPIADNIQVQGLVNAGAGTSQTSVGVVSGSTIANPVAASNTWSAFTAMLPNVNQNLYYNNSVAPAATYINILGYTVPNGG